MRQTIAKRLTESKQQIPHYSLTIEIEMDQVLKMREELNVALDQGKLSINDFIVKVREIRLKVNVSGRNALELSIVWVNKIYIFDKFLCTKGSNSFVVFLQLFGNWYHFAGFSAGVQTCSCRQLVVHGHFYSRVPRCWR